MVRTAEDQAQHEVDEPTLETLVRRLTDRVASLEGRLRSLEEDRRGAR